MGSVRFGLHVSFGLALGLAWVTGCTTEPALDRCNAFNAFATDRAMVSTAETLIAIADTRANTLTYVRRSCAPGEQVVSHCGLQRHTVENIPAKAVLLSGDGRWITYVDQLRLHRLDTRDPDDKVDTGITVTSLVGALRSGSWMVFRFRDEYGLRALNAETATAIELDEGKHLLALALGDRSIIARERESGMEHLFLAKINPAHPGADRSRAELLPLGELAYVNRVVITRGETPAERGDYDAVDPHIPLDEYVIVTGSDQPPSAELPAEEIRWTTQVFDAGTAQLITSFVGRVSSGIAPLVELPGIAAIAPDQRNIAYTAPDGALALHDLDSADSCRVRAGTAAEHDIAGFAADGTLFFRAKDGVNQRVFAYSTANRSADLLTGDRHDQTLAAVPTRTITADGRQVPWAVTAGQGYRGAASGNDRAVPLGGLPLSKTTFVPLPGPHLWTVNARETDDGERLAIELRRVEASAGIGRTVEFSETVPRIDGDDPLDTVALEYPISRSLCVSIARVGEWLSECTTAKNLAPWAKERIPTSEL